MDKRDQATLQAHQQNLVKWNHIQTDKRFPLVKEVWEAKLKDPNFVMQVQNGMVDPLAAYQETVLDYFEGVSKRSLDTIKQLHGGPGIQVPHTETGERVPTNLVSTDPSTDVPDSVKKARALKEKTDKGYMMTDEEEMDVIDSLLHAPVASTTPALDPRK